MLERDDLPLYYDLLDDAIVVHEECPGVQYLCIERRDNEPSEYYIVEQTSSVISDEAKQYGTPFADSPDRLAFALDDETGGKAIIEYEIRRYRVVNRLPMPDSEPLNEYAEYAAELHPEYFGALLPPRLTPRGKSLRCRALMNGVYLHETDKCELIVSVCPPLCDDDLSDYTRGLGIMEQDCLLFTEQDACLALFELAQSYPDLKASAMIDWPALATAIWERHAEYALAYNLKEQAGLNDPSANLLQAIGVEVESTISLENLIAMSAESGVMYLRFGMER